VQTNDADHNEVAVFGRRDDGTLELLGAYLTDGKGSGAPHLPSQSSVVVDGDRLFVTNAGSGDGRFLYALRADTGRVFGWKVGADGTLDPVGAANGLPLTAAGLAPASSD